MGDLRVPNTSPLSRKKFAYAVLEIRLLTEKTSYLGGYFFLSNKQLITGNLRMPNTTPQKKKKNTVTFLRYGF
jgi:hypothetical protein